MWLRETWAGWAPPYFPKGTHLGFGDGGHGFGLCQADDRTWEAAMLGLMPGVELLTPLGQARFTAHKLARNERILRVVFPALDAVILRKAAIAAYNARLGAVAQQLYAGRDVDSVTSAGPTGHGDYSADVLRRAYRLEQRDHVLFPPAAG